MPKRCFGFMPYADVKDERCRDLADVARDFVGGIPPLPDHTFFDRREFDTLRRAIKGAAVAGIDRNSPLATIRCKPHR